MRDVKKLTDNKFINIKEVTDPDNHVRGYQFAERLGVDSVAFICWDASIDKFLLNKEYKPPIDDVILGAFGGSIDNDKTHEEIVIAETKQEAGFVVTGKDVHYLGRVMVSTQMNQFCHLYLVNVDKKKQVEREPENAIEAMAKIEWVQWDMDIVNRLEEWKSLAIISKAEALGVL